MPLASSGANGVNYSASFVISNNCLDTCPKCGLNICEHTSVAEVIHLPNSISQDFSTYSSDSSLIKQLFSDSTSSTSGASTTVPSNDEHSQNRCSMNEINLNCLTGTNNDNKKIEPHLEQYLILLKKYNENSDLNGRRDLNKVKFTSSLKLRPKSCHLSAIDNDTTDKIIREFFDASAAPMTKYSTIGADTANGVLKESANNNWHSSPKTTELDKQQQKTEEELLKVEKQEKTKKKKMRFSNFRLFLKSGSKEDGAHKSSPSKTLLRSNGLVNCLTSSASSSSSSCEEMGLVKGIGGKKAYKLKEVSLNTNLKQSDSSHTTTNTTNSDQNATELSEESNESLNTTIKCASNENVDSAQKTATTTTTSPTSSSNSSSSSDENMNRSSINRSSVVSLHSKITNYMCDEEDDYNELHNLELCPIVVSDADEASYTNDDAAPKLTDNCTCSCANFNSDEMKKKQKNNHHRYHQHHTTNAKCTNCTSTNITTTTNLNSNNNNNNTIVNNYTNVNNINNISSIISVPLNNYLFYNYERKEEEFANKQKSGGAGPTRPKSSISSNAGESAESTLSRPLINDEKYKKMSGVVSSSVSYDLNVESHLKKADSISYRKETKVTAEKKPKNKNHHRHSYFSSCSSCNSSIKESTITTTTTNTNTTSSLSTLASPRYHSISIIFIIIGLFSINLLQESFLLFYYFNTEQFYWLIYSLVALFAGQTLTLIMSLLAEIDLINFTPPRPNLAQFNDYNNIKLTSTSASSSAQSTPLTKPKKPLINKEQNIRLLKQQQTSEEKLLNEQFLNDNSDLHSIFTNPFSKLFLLIPGFLPVSVFIQFLKHLYHYRKASAEIRFKYEFHLALYLFFNAVFHSLPLAMINACYLASTATSHSFTWYYTELFSLFSATTAYFQTTTTTATTRPTVLINDSGSVEKRNQLVLLIVSIFISVSIGVCLFTTYFELMKQMNYLSFLRVDGRLKNSRLLVNSFSFGSKRKRREEKDEMKEDVEGNEGGAGEDEDNFDDSAKLFNLGLVEILVYFCYKFCLITSRLAIIALFWHLFHEWLLFAFFVHVLLSYLSTFLTVRKTVRIENKRCTFDSVDKNNLGKENENFNTSIDKPEKIKNSESLKEGSNGPILATVRLAGENKKQNESKINQHLTLFIICLLGFIDLFMNQISELNHIKKVITYYVIYFVQNLSVLTYWLVKSVLNARLQLEQQQENSLDDDQPKITKEMFEPSLNRNILLVLKSSSSSFSTVSNTLKQQQQLTLPQHSTLLFSPGTFACYTSVIYFCFVLFTVFGLILKFLHLHITRKRLRKLYN